jgi:hypothetical protein
LFPDFDYYLKAKMPREDFEPYCATIGLTPHFPGRVYTDGDRLSWRSWSYHEVDWWDPSESEEGTYVSQEGHDWVFAKYENGEVYVRAFSH